MIIKPLLHVAALPSTIVGTFNIEITSSLKQHCLSDASSVLLMVPPMPPASTETTERRCSVAFIAGGMSGGGGGEGDGVGGEGAGAGGGGGCATSELLPSPKVSSFSSQF